MSAFSPYEKAMAIYNLNNENIRYIASLPVWEGENLGVSDGRNNSDQCWKTIEKGNSPVQRKIDWKTSYRQQPYKHPDRLFGDIGGNYDTIVDYNDCVACNKKQLENIKRIESDIIPEKQARYYERVQENLLVIQDLLTSIIQASNMAADTKKLKMEFEKEAEEIEKRVDAFINKFRLFF